MPLRFLDPVILRKTSVPPDCVKTNDLCKFVWNHTHNSWVASSSFWLIIKPLRIILIIVVAMIARWLLHRAIRRLIRRTSHGSMTSVFRAQATSAAARVVGVPVSMVETSAAPVSPGATGAVPQRRQQRAEAIGSILLSFATAAIFSIAGLMVLAELGIQLAPLLASAGIAGIALGFGAQTLVKDLLAGLFMLLEDQYGVGDAVDVGEASGIVESVGMRITSIRDPRGVLWHVRNGEIVRVGNKSQGWALGIIDIPIGFAKVDEATKVLTDTAEAFAADTDWSKDLIDPPAVLGVERVGVDGAVLRVTVKTTTESAPLVGRELRTRLTAALGESGIIEALTSNRLYVRSSDPDDPNPPLR
jgi:small conductance mechanosensitive channel